MNSSPAVLFQHIPRTAGTTMRRILERQYEPATIFQLYSNLHQEAISRFQGLSEAQRRKVRLVMGHFLFGLHESIPGPSQYITFLRDPIERMVSDYWFIRANTGHIFHQRVMEMSLTQFLNSGLVPANGITRGLSGTAREVPFGSLGREHLERARNNLESHFAVVGLLERFDESLVLLKATLGWRDPFYIKENINLERRPTREIDAAEIELVRERIQLDIELYESVKALFERQLNRFGPQLLEEAKTFTRENQELGRLNETATGALEAGDLQVAWDTWEKALSIDPNSAPVHSGLARCLLKADRQDDALLHVAAALRADPYDRKVVLLAAELFLSLGDADRAADVYSFYQTQHDPYDWEILQCASELDARQTPNLLELKAAATRLQFGNRTRV